MTDLVKKILFIPYRCIRKPLYLLSRIFYHLYKLPEQPTVVVCMDGGLCSQMFDYALGELFRRNGYVVKYDLMWFRKYGRDVFGKDARFFEIKKLFPNLKIQKASRVCIENFKDKCGTSESDITKIIEAHKNVYLVNDHPLILPFDELNQIKTELFSNPKEPKDKINRALAEEIRNDKYSCAVHVRRGDLANSDVAKKSGYGDCITDNYYLNAIKIMKELIPNVKFYFFSDDLQYVENILIKKFQNINYKIVDINSITVKKGGGYKDFYLIYLCKNQICSLGSFGNQAAQLNKNEEKIIISYKQISNEIRNQIIMSSYGELKSYNLSRFNLQKLNSILLSLEIL